MKKGIILLLTVLIFTLAACTASIEDQLDKANSYRRSKEYGKAEEVYKAILDEDASIYKAWDGLVKVYIKDDEYDEAEESLEAYFDLLKEDYESYNIESEVDYEDLFEDIAKHAKDIIKEGESVGTWYDQLKIPNIDVSEIAYSQDIAVPIILEVPEGADVYYTIDGTNPNHKSTRYDDGMLFDEVGEYDVKVMAYNRFDMNGKISDFYINIYEKSKALEFSVEPGEYDESFTLYFNDYDYDTMDMSYTLDGTDPVEGDNYYYYYEEDGIYLKNGVYEIRATYYDYTTDSYSSETVGTYTINNKNAVNDYTELTLAIFGVENAAYVIEEAMSDLYYGEDNMVVNTVTVDELDELFRLLKSGEVDLVYSEAEYVEDMSAENLLGDVEALMDIKSIDYYSEAYEAGAYKDNYYTLPVLISPSSMLYYQGDDSYEMTIDTWEALIEIANNGTSTYNFLYPEDNGGSYLYSFYQGFGGTYEIDAEGHGILDPEPLKVALKFAYDLTPTYGLGYEGMDYETYITAFENNYATLILSNNFDQQAYDYDIDYYNDYTATGLMPLPSGMYASSINFVSGLHITPGILEDENKAAAARTAYRYLTDKYYVNYMAAIENAVPAIKSSVDRDELYLVGKFENYENAIIMNKTVPYTYATINTYSIMSKNLSEVLYSGLTIDEAVENIVTGVYEYRHE